MWQQYQSQRLNEEINLRRAELNSWESEISNAVRTYQNFIDRNLALKKREDELQLSINELEARMLFLALALALFIILILALRLAIKINV